MNAKLTPVRVNPALRHPAESRMSISGQWRFRCFRRELLQRHRALNDPLPPLPAPVVPAPLPSAG